MEHRNGRRFKQHVELEVWRAGCCLGTYTSANISYGGVFLQQCDGVLAQGDFVSINVVNQQLVPVQCSVMKAIVVHRSEGGVGLMWADSHAALWTIIEENIQVAA